MLTKNEKTVLDHLILLHSEKDITRIEASDNIDGISGKELELIFENLKHNGYIEVRRDITGSCKISVTYKGLSYSEIESASMHPVQTFNISNVNNSAFGNIGPVTFTNSISTLRENIENSDSSDKEALRKITDILEMIQNDDIPPKKGLLSKFSDVLERNGWYTPQAASILFNWLMSQ